MKSTKVVSTPYHFLEKHWKFLLLTYIVYNLKVCYDFVPSLFWQAQLRWFEEKDSSLVYALYCF